MGYKKNEIIELIAEQLRKKEHLEEMDSGSAMGGGYSGENAETGGFFIGPLGNVPRKELNKRLAFKDGKIVTKVNGQSVTEQMLLEWFGGSQVRSKDTFNAKPFWKDGKFVEIKPKCLTFPYCSEGDSADKPIELIGESKEASSPCSWDIVSVIAEQTKKTPETIAKLIREHYLKLELL